MKKGLIFRKISATEPVINYLSGVISQHLENGERVLWLVPGGSAIQIAVAVSQRMASGKLKNLTVTLTDERYGPVGHKDSNWLQLDAAGFKFNGANQIPVLTNIVLKETADRYAKRIEAALKQSDYSIALAGMGADGHILGIMPRSPAVSSRKLAVGYSWDDFSRITLTPWVISQLDEVVIYAVGKEKWPQLEALKGELQVIQQPAQILKQAKMVTVFSDYRSS